MELYNIYYSFWEGMKEISVGVCLNEYTWLEICEQEKWIVLEKTNWKKNGLEQKKKNGEKKDEKERKELEVQF